MTAVCDTLRELDIQFPPGEKFKYKRVEVGGIVCRNAICNCWGWEDSTKFLDQVAATFPNVRYHILDERRVKVRKDAREKWIQVGRRMGFLGKDDNAGGCETGEGEIKE